jgi:hypothetical protein
MIPQRGVVPGSEGKEPGCALRRTTSSVTAIEKNSLEIEGQDRFIDSCSPGFSRRREVFDKVSTRFWRANLHVS